MADVNRIFTYLENPSIRLGLLKACKLLIVGPVNMRRQINQLINKEIKFAKHKKPAGITLKFNSLSDGLLIGKLTEAAKAGVQIKLIIRGICCMFTENRKFKKPIEAISIIDEYLEHARVMIFENNSDPKVFISSADWMVRNINHRIEVACPVLEKDLRDEIINIIDIQLKDNIKARELDNELSNQYINPRNTKKIRSQIEIFNYLNRATSSK